MFMSLLSTVHTTKQDWHAYSSDGKGTASKREKLCEYNWDLVDVTNMDDQIFHVSQQTPLVVLWQNLGWKFVQSVECSSKYGLSQ